MRSLISLLEDIELEKEGCDIFQKLQSYKRISAEAKTVDDLNEVDKQIYFKEKQDQQQEMITSWQHALLERVKYKNPCLINLEFDDIQHPLELWVFPCYLRAGRVQFNF